MKKYLPFTTNDCACMANGHMIYIYSPHRMKWEKIRDSLKPPKEYLQNFYMIKTNKIYEYYKPVWFRIMNEFSDPKGNVTTDGSLKIEKMWEVLYDYCGNDPEKVLELIRTDSETFDRISMMVRLGNQNE